MKSQTLHSILLAAATLAILFTACGPAKQTQRPGATYTPNRSLTTREQTELVKEVKTWLGTKYKYGGHSRKGTDCSGMVMEVYRKVCDMALPRSSREQQAYCKGISKKDLTEGDLVFFATGRGKTVSHVGMYIGGGKIVHASASKGVIVSQLDDKYYLRTYHSSGRVLASNKSKAKRTDKVRPASTTPPPTVKPQPTPEMRQSVEKDILREQFNEVIDMKVDSIYSTMFD